jgi:hypothetical protein
MKGILLPLILCLCACASTRKNVQTTSESEVVQESTATQSAKTEKMVDTTKTESGKIILTEIEFYPPTVIEAHKDTTARQMQSINNIGDIKGATIKSIKQTIIESHSEQNGKSREASETDGKQSEAILVKNEQTIHQDVSPAPDPYRWRYIFYILVLISVVLLYLKRVPVLNWIKTMLLNIQRIF